MSGCAAQQSLQGLYATCSSQQLDGTLLSYNDDDCTYCKLCNVSFPSRPMYAFHVRGLGHTQQLMAVQAGMFPSWTEARRVEARPWQGSGTLPARPKTKNFTQSSSLCSTGYLNDNSNFQGDPAHMLAGDGCQYPYPGTNSADMYPAGQGYMAGGSSDVMTQHPNMQSMEAVPTNSTFSQYGQQSFPQNYRTDQPLSEASPSMPQNYGVYGACPQPVPGSYEQSGSSLPAANSSSGQSVPDGNLTKTNECTSLRNDWKTGCVQEDEPFFFCEEGPRVRSLVSYADLCEDTESSSRATSGRGKHNRGKRGGAQQRLKREICALKLSVNDVQNHLSGKKHMKALNNREKGKPLPQSVQKRLAESGQVAGPGISTDLVEAFVAVPKSDPVVGLAYVSQEQDGELDSFYCDLCQYKTTVLSTMVSHVLSMGHRLAYIKKFEPDLLAKVDQTQSEFIQHHTLRVICIEVEERSGRGVPMLRNPVKNSLELKLVTDKTLGLQKVANEEYEPKSLEDVMIVGAKRILHLQQLIAEAAQKGTTLPISSSADDKKLEEKTDSEQEKLTPEEERTRAIEDLKKTLMDDFSSRNMDSQLAEKIVESRLQLLYEYERRGVAFDVARTRVIQEEERYNLLLEFERQNLSFEEAEQRIDHRFQLCKMYEKKGMSVEAARKKVLDEEVIHDFKIEFQGLGFPRDQAQKQAERRVWLLDNLEKQGMSQEEASRRVADMEWELKRSLGIAQGTGSSKSSSRYDSVVTKHSTEETKWQQAEEAVCQHVRKGCEQLSLTHDQVQDLLAEALNCLARYRRERVSPEEAKRRVFWEDLPITVDLDVSLLTGQGSMSHKSTASGSLSVKPEVQPADDDSGNPKSETAITDRISHFLNKLNSQIIASAGEKTGSDSCAHSATSMEGKNIDPPNSQTAALEGDTQESTQVLTDEDRERLLEEHDRKSRLEIQNLLAEMLRLQVPPEEAKGRLEALYKVHETMREKLFPANSKAKSATHSKSSKQKKSSKSKHKDRSSDASSAAHSSELSKKSHHSQKTEDVSCNKSGGRRERFSPDKHHKNYSQSPPRKKKARSRTRSPLRTRKRCPGPQVRKLRQVVRSPLRKSRSPLLRKSRSPLPRKSRSPLLRKSRSPLRQKSRSPSLRKSRSPLRQKSRSPLLRKSRSPLPRKSRSPLLRKSRSPLLRKSRSPLLQKSRSPLRQRSRSPFLRRSRNRSPQRSRGSLHRRSRSRSSHISRSPYSGHSRSPSPLIQRRRRRSISPCGASDMPPANPEDSWKSSVDMFLKQTCVRNARRSRSGSSNRSGRYKSLSRSVSRSASPSPRRPRRRRSQGLSSISSVSDRGIRAGGPNRTRRSFSRSPSVGLRSGSPVPRTRYRSNSRDLSSVHSRHSRDGSRQHNSSRHSADSRERMRPHRRRSNRSSGSRDTSRHSRDGSRSSRNRHRPGTGRSRSKYSSSPDGTPQRSMSREDSLDRVSSPLKWRGRGAGTSGWRDIRTPSPGRDRHRSNSLERVSSPSLSSSSSSFCIEEDRIQYPLGPGPPPPPPPPPPFGPPPW